MTPRLEVQNLSWRVGARQVLQNVSFAVGPGEVVGLLGPNGSGKSSVLRCLLGSVSAGLGTLRLDGVHVPLGGARLRQRTGVVFQGQSLDGKLTVAENLALGARLYGLRGAVAAARCAALLDSMELTARAHERAEVLSGGLRRRLELARALLPSPDVLLLDEPTQGLDPLAQRRLWARLQVACAQDGVGILVSTHDAEEAARCSRVVVLVEGRAVAHDTPAALLARVGGDVIELTCGAEQVPADVARELTQALGVCARVHGDVVAVEQADGPSWVPRLVQAVGASRLRATSVRRPSLADAFYALTGTALSGAPAPADKGAR